ncbi:MAG TPA: CARDB domain-containing protein, partial [Rhodothermales bacterium]|nr:CARDB domain-containing protein [Rhodothermales bacterium]
MQHQTATACGPTLDVVSGAAFNIHTRLANAGKSRVTSQSTRLYFSTDATIDPSTDLSLSNIGVGIDAGDSYPSPTTYTARNVTLPGTAPGGTGFVGAFADYNDTVTESDETNNTGSTAINVLAPPDLVMDTFSISTGTTSADGTPSSPGFGSNVDITFTVRNQGTTDAGTFSVRFAYDDDTNGTGTHLNTTTFSAGLAAGATTASTTVTVSLPGNVLYGLNANGNARFIHFNIDPFLQVPEDDETNNTGFTPIDITGQPDLEVIRLCLFASGSPQQCTDDAGYTPPTQISGGQLPATYTILNNGFSRALSVENGLYFSTDATIDTGDQLLTTRTHSLNAGAQAFPNAFFLTLPAGATPGPAYVGLFADHNAQSNESDETNNTGVAEMIVASGIDLMMATFNVPDAQGSGSSLALSVEVGNVGANKAGAFTVRFFYDDDTDASSGQTSLGNCNFSSIPAGGTSGMQTCSVTLPTTVLSGTRFIHYNIDVNNQISESDEAN